MEENTEPDAQFLKQIKRNMELINDNLGDVDKINVVNKHLTNNAAEWFTIIQGKVITYQELVANSNRDIGMNRCREMCAYNERSMIHRATNKLTRHFAREIQIAVITQPVKTLEELMILLRR